jgi:hypothetical protein
MKISATAQGGFTGQGEHYDIDTATSSHGRELEAALKTTGFFNAHARANDAVGADLLHWTITVDDGKRRHSITFREDGTPANARWQQLLRTLRAAA